MEPDAAGAGAEEGGVDEPPKLGPADLLPHPPPELEPPGLLPHPLPVPLGMGALDILEGGLILIWASELGASGCAEAFDKEFESEPCVIHAGKFETPL